MIAENISQEFRLKNINETKKYFIEKIKQNKLISKKRKRNCKILNYIEHLLFWLIWLLDLFLFLLFLL